MKKKQIMLGLLIIGVCIITAAYAESIREPVTAYLDNNLKLMIDGNAFTVNENDGKKLYPLIYNNQIYLPLNTFNGKAGLTVDFDETDHAVCIKTKEYVESQETPLHFHGNVKKPNIYLYPTTKQEVTVKLTFAGTITTAYPIFNPQINGWQVTAFPDGKIINQADQREYSYLFWEGKNEPINYDLTQGYVVAGEDTMKFLQDTLAKMGLTPKEYNEFIVYWLPKMQDNQYNLVTFAGKEYTDNAKLEIAPQPDSILRVFMVFKPLTEKITIKAPEIKPFIRKGFTVVEWGGTELR
jgi:hypothetical protein